MLRDPATRLRVINILSGLAVLALCVAAYVWIIPAEVRMIRTGGASPHAFPNALAVVTGAAALLLVLQQVLPRRDGAADSDEDDDEGLHMPSRPAVLATGTAEDAPAHDRLALAWPWLLLLAALGFAMAMPWVGFVISAALGLGVMLLIFGETKPLPIAAIAVSGPILTKAFFQFVLGIRLPESGLPIPFI